MDDEGGGLAESSDDHQKGSQAKFLVLFLCQKLHDQASRSKCIQIYLHTYMYTGTSSESQMQAIYLTTSKTFETSTPAPAPSASCLALACS